MLVLAGMVASGKSTLSNRLAEHYNSKLFLEPVDDNPILPLYYDDMKRYGFLLQVYFLNKRFDIIKKAMEEENAILDRSIYEDELFSSINLELGNMTEIEFLTYKDLLDNMMEEVDERNKKVPELLIYLDINFDKFLSNLKKRGREYEQINLNTEKGKKDLAYFKLLHSKYEDWFKSYDKSPKIRINMNDIDVNKDEDFYYVLDLIEEKRKLMR